MKKSLMALLVVGCLVGGLNSQANADETFVVDTGANWLGYMNVFELPINGGGFVFGSGWGTADLCANFSGSTLTLAPNSVNDASSFWYTPSGGPGSTSNSTGEYHPHISVPAPPSTPVSW